MSTPPTDHVYLTPYMILTSWDTVFPMITFGVFFPIMKVSWNIKGPRYKNADSPPFEKSPLRHCIFTEDAPKGGGLSKNV